LNKKDAGLVVGCGGVGLMPSLLPSSGSCIQFEAAHGASLLWVRRRGFKLLVF